MNTHDVFSRIHDFDLDVPPDLDLDDIAPMLSKMAPTATSTSTSTSTKETTFPWNLNMNNMNLAALPAAADHFALLHSTATQLYTDHAGTLQSLGASIKPHLRGPLTPVLIIAVSILVSVLVSFIVSILQLAVLAAAVVYFFPSVLAAAGNAVPTAMAGATAKRPVSRTPVAAFAGVLAASYAFSSIATMVVLASSAYAYLNHAAVTSAKTRSSSTSSSTSNSSSLRPDGRSTRRDESAHMHTSMFRRISRHRDSY